MRSSSVLAVFVLLASFGESQQQIHTYTAGPFYTPFGVLLRRSVVNVELTCKQGDKWIQAEGTGFIVARTDSRLPKDSGF